jgi:hypothetical protein
VHRRRLQRVCVSSDRRLFSSPPCKAYPYGKKKALFSFLDVSFHGRVCIFTIDRTQLPSVSVTVSQGFLSLDDCSYAFGSGTVGAAAQGAPGIHLSDCLIGLVRRRGVWKGAVLQPEFSSLVKMTALHIESGLSRYQLIPIRHLPEVKGRTGKNRHVADLERKEEMVQLAARTGATLTASRLTTAARAFASGGGSSSSSSSSGSGSPARPDGSVSAGGFAFAGKHGACAFFTNLEVVPTIAPLTKAPPVDRIRYEGPSMKQYNLSTKTTLPPGILQIATDGVLFKSSGEVNQYFALTPARKFGAVKEACAWLPVQVQRFHYGSRVGPRTVIPGRGLRSYASEVVPHRGLRSDASTADPPAHHF